MMRIRLVCAGVLVAGFIALGCSPANKATPAQVSGSLSYKGEPIKGGTMAFHTSEGTAYAAQVSQDGTYVAHDLPEGDLTVTVNTESLKPAPGTGKDAAKRMKMSAQQPPPGVASTTPADVYVKIPEKYASPKTSPLKATLKAGRQTQNFDLID